MWIPDGVGLVRGVWWIVNRGQTQNAYLDRLDNRDRSKPAGQTTIGNRALARELELAMAYDASDTGKGTDPLAVLRAIALQSGHPELAFAGLIPMGISGGGQASSRMLGEFPERIITVIPSHQSLTNVHESSAALTVPRLDLTAGADAFIDSHPTVICGPAILSGRSLDAPWAFMIHPNGAHPFWAYNEFMLMHAWLRAVLPMRLPSIVPIDANATFAPVRPGSGHWLGTIDYSVGAASLTINEVTISRHETFTGDKTKAYWLPSEAFARQWMQRMGFDPDTGARKDRE